MNGYMLLHADPTKAIKNPYQLITINYFPTSIERLYKIGVEGDWQNYRDKPIWVDQGETIYAKGIDKYGNDTRIVSQHIASVPEALGKEVYDGNASTYVSQTNVYLKIDSSVEGKKIEFIYIIIVSLVMYLQ